MAQHTSVDNSGFDNQNEMKSTKQNGLNLIWGILLILAGFLFLAQNLGAFDFLGFIPETIWALIWMGLFGVAGLTFLGGLLLYPRHWWMAIPGFALLGLSGTIAAEEILTFIPFEGSIFLGSLGLGFLTVYLLNREMWWALIPGGVLETLAVVAAIDEIGAFDSGAIFFVGLGLTFALVALVPTPKGQMRWAWIPAGVLLTLAVAVLLSAEVIFNLIWPLILVGIGILVLARNLLQRSS